MNQSSLTKGTIVLHWLVAITFIVVLSLGLYMEELPKGPDKYEIMGIHKSLGFAFLFLSALRLGWRIREGSIPALTNVHTWQVKFAKGLHHFLLLATIVMPISGLMMSIGGGHGLEFFGAVIVEGGEKIEWLGGLGHELHEVIANLAILLLLLHVVGALKHHIINKDATLKRMLGMQ